MDDATPLGITGGLIGIGGRFTLPTKASKLLLVAGGIGVTPFLSMLNSIVTSDTSEPWDVVSIISTREPHLTTELIQHALGANPSPKIRLITHIFTSQTWPPLDSPVVLHVGRLKDSFFQTLEDIQDRTVLVCGPTAFEETVMQGLRCAGVDQDSISRENFTY